MSTSFKMAKKKKRESKKEKKEMKINRDRQTDTSEKHIHFYVIKKIYNSVI